MADTVDCRVTTFECHYIIDMIYYNMHGFSKTLPTDPIAAIPLSRDVPTTQRVLVTALTHRVASSPYGTVTDTLAPSQQVASGFLQAILARCHGCLRHTSSTTLAQTHPI